MLDLKNLLAKVKRSYLVGLCLIVFLLSASFFTLSYLAKSQRSDASLINIAGKQRALSQKLIFEVYKAINELEQLQQHSSTTDNISNKIKLTTNEMSKNHDTLINGTEDILTLTRDLYFDAKQPLHQSLTTLIKSARTISEMKNAEMANNTFRQEFSDTKLLAITNALNHVVEQMENFSANRLLNIEKGIVLLWIFTLIGLITFTMSAYRKITAIVSSSFIELKKEKNKLADIEFAINKHSIVFRVGLDHKIQYVNDKFCQLYGYQTKDIIGQHQEILGSNEHDKLLFDEMHQKISAGKVWKKELCNIDKKGWKHWLETTIVPITHNDQIISHMAIQNEITEQKLMGFALGEIHSIIAEANKPCREKINKLLSLGCDLYHLPLAIVSEISDMTYTVKYSQSPNSEISAGDIYDVENTYCIHTLNANKPTAFHHAGISEIKKHPCYLGFGLESYIGCPIMVGDKRYGTLNFSGSEIRHAGPFSKNDLELIQLIAQWIGYEILKENQQNKMLSQQLLMEKMSTQARIGAWEVDLITEEIIWSAMTKEIHQVPDDYVPELSTAINFYKEGASREKIIELVNKAIEKGVPFEEELELTTIKGNSIWVATRCETVLENGKCIKLYGSFQDISERKKIQQEIIDKNRRMNLAADSAGIGVWELDLITDELRWDDWMFRLYGVDPEEFCDAYQAREQGIHPDDVALVTQHRQDAIAGKSKYNTQFRVIYPNGTIRYIKADALVLKDKHNNPYTMVGVNYDITDRVETELALTQAKEFAEKATNVKNEFLASMSHEIRTPMNGVVGMLDLLSETALTEEQKHQVIVAKSSADSLLYLINDILDFSKIDANKLELEALVFDIKLLVSEFADTMMQQAQKKGLELIVDTVSVNEPLVIGDPNRIRQIFTNLVSNAIKFTAQGEVVIKLILLPDSDDSWRLRIKVQDTGLGIEKDKQANIFENFQQVDSSTTREFGGTGLGLAIVKKLCQCMDGNVSLISDVGEGSIFICDVKVGKTAQVTPELPHVDISHINVLVVDDNQTNREVLSKQLKNWQVNVVSVESAAAALHLCESILELGHQPLFDIAILDMQMPEMDGAELGRRFRANKQFDAMKLVMMTSMRGQGDAKFFADLGFNAYFPKPASSSDIYNAINILIDEGKAYEGAKPLITRHYIKTLDHLEESLTTNEAVPEQWPDSSKVLLVEDNRINQMVAKGVLAKLEMPCEVAVNGQEALDKLSKDPNFTLILMDCQMPVMDGYQTTEQIRAGQASDNYKNIPIIAMTANAMQGDREKCLAAGMDDYLAKPIDKESVQEKLVFWHNNPTNVD
ncbi:MAG: response regulator [Thalassotalea sp.]